jgi:hypothetical protein
MSHGLEVMMMNDLNLKALKLNAKQEPEASKKYELERNFICRYI